MTSFWDSSREDSLDCNRFVTILQAVSFSSSEDLRDVHIEPLAGSGKNEDKRIALSCRCQRQSTGLLHSLNDQT